MTSSRATELTRPRGGRRRVGDRRRGACETVGRAATDVDGRRRTSRLEGDQSGTRRSPVVRRSADCACARGCQRSQPLMREATAPDDTPRPLVPPAPGREPPRARSPTAGRRRVARPRRHRPLPVAGCARPPTPRHRRGSSSAGHRSGVHRLGDGLALVRRATAAGGLCRRTRPCSAHETDQPDSAHFTRHHQPVGLPAARSRADHRRRRVTDGVAHPRDA